jgi:hypothetical protein
MPFKREDILQSSNYASELTMSASEQVIVVVMQGNIMHVESLAFSCYWVKVQVLWQLLTGVMVVLWQKCLRLYGRHSHILLLRFIYIYPAVSLTTEVEK